MSVQGEVHVTRRELADAINRHVGTKSSVTEDAVALAIDKFELAVRRAEREIARGENKP